jgi:hypothetical protein
MSYSFVPFSSLKGCFALFSSVAERRGDDDSMLMHILEQLHTVMIGFSAKIGNQLDANLILVLFLHI